MNINQVHNKFEHADEASTHNAAKEQEVETVRGMMKPYVACAIGKAKQKNVLKTSEHKPATKDDRHIFLDIAGAQERSNCNQA
jgi:hypothetical protein